MWIKVTAYTTGEDTPTILRVNTDKISIYSGSDNTKYNSLIFIENHNPFYVKETPEEIDQMLDRPDAR